MARIEDVKLSDISSAKIVAIRASIGDSSFFQELDRSSGSIHDKAHDAWTSGELTLHERLIDIGWILRRYERGG